MKKNTFYPQISKGLARFLRKKRKTHFKQKDLTFDSISAKHYLQLFKSNQKNISLEKV